MTQNEWTVGWFGKLPCVGDFIRAGLSPQFISAWDSWMQTMVAAGSEALQENWLGSYMTAPIWRFALPRDVCGPNAAAGIFMPSVDRVGRQFPFCLCVEDQSEDGQASAWDLYQGLSPIYENLENIALSMLDDGATIDALQGALSTLPERQETTVSVTATHLGNADLIACDDTVERQLTNLAARSGATLWVSAIEDIHRTMVCRGMPESRNLAAVFFDFNAPVWNPGHQGSNQLEGNE